MQRSLQITLVRMRILVIIILKQIQLRPTINNIH